MTAAEFFTESLLVVATAEDVPTLDRQYARRITELIDRGVPVAWLEQLAATWRVRDRELFDASMGGAS